MSLSLSEDEIIRMRRAADRDEIRQLAYRYAWGLDSRDVDRVAELYAPEADSGDGYIEPRDGPHPGRFVEQAILYRDRYRRVGGSWKFVSRSHELWFGIETAERPLHQRPAEWPLHHDGLGSVPYSEPTWQAFWSAHESDST